MNKVKLAIIDCIGLNYDGTTLFKKGIGGSESSIISVAKELVKLGFDVTIFNDCDTEETSPGIYDGVEYYPVRTLGERNFNFDIVISQRTVIPFTPLHLYDQVRQPPPRDYDPAIFAQIQDPKILKIIWMQDTFIWGDHLLELLIIHKCIDEIFCLSDWHISYTTNSSHGPKRNFEVLKNHVFHTRNAINRWIDWVDVKKKDPNLFVYNASITKGMDPLVRMVWPRIKERLPNAKLKIIGGYYRFRDEQVSEAQQKVLDLQDLTKDDPSVEFTGIIPQPKIAEIMAEASYNLYPAAYPETSGISSIESINYNTPIIGCRFGALEESGTEQASYFMDYAIEPNGLFPWINKEEQVNRYVDLVFSVVNNPYLHQQKQYACNSIKDVSTWDTVALQWKQHFYNKLGLELDREEVEKVEWINYRVHKAFSRRYMNLEEVKIVEPTSLPIPFKNQKATLAIIDIVGMTYDGDSLNRKGLGGSESAVILVSRELAKIGFDVTVFSACDEDDSNPGIYDNVTYRPLKDIAEDQTIYDVVISSRCVTPFVPEYRFDYPQTTNRKFSYSDFDNIRKSKLKVFWMHDTFCWGDDILEDLVVNNAIDEIWNLSDFHAMYTMNCSHPNLRNFEVLRRKMWTTRNGIVKYFDSVDIDSKDPNMFVFNANMSKGLAPLLDTIWPKVIERIPQARLTVIGGFYKLGAAFEHDNEESEFTKIAGPHMQNPTITFTGIINQREVAEIFAKSSFFIYPASLPETYGISTLESLYANTPLLTCKFGALEETASIFSSYINYAVVPNGLFPNINPETQAEDFVNMVCDMYNNPGLLREKMKSLDIIKDLVGWEVTALEWKQHIFNKLGLYLSRGESQKAIYTKSKYHKYFKRRSSTSEEWLAPAHGQEQRIVVISPFYNAANYIEKCILSVAAQNYNNYVHILIDDCSTDDSSLRASITIDGLPDDIKNKFLLIRNDQNLGAVFNHVNSIRGIEDDAIVMLLDGDDSLINRPDIFTYYNKIHREADFTYGSCWSMVDSIPLHSQPYPPEVKELKDYKNYKFNWNMPYTHLRSFKARLLKYEPDSCFQDEQGNWYKAGGDNSTFYTALANTDPSRVYVVSDLVYNYNDASPLNDYKINREEQDKAILSILNKKEIEVEIEKIEIIEEPKYESPVMKKRILLAIPTNRNIEAQTFKSIYDLIIPDGYEVTFQYFWGYQVDQVRNLIAHWIVDGNFDYLFAVDSDIAFEKDTLKKLLSHDKDIVTGLYIQRIPGTHTLEVMRKNVHGGVSHVDYADIKGQGLVPIDGCGFGCVLVKGEVFRAIPYPHFLYHSAIDHSNTLSEDVHFCNQARDRGFTLWADTSILCEHIGSWTFRVDDKIVAKTNADRVKERIRELSNMTYLYPPPDHHNYLVSMRDNMNIKPAIIYDIGANVLHWLNPAREIWPNAEFIAFDASECCGFLYEEHGLKYHVELLSDEDNKDIVFYENKHDPGANSYYRENPEFSPNADAIFNDENKVIRKSIKLDTLVKNKRLPLPDLIKMDVQGAELDIIKGATETLKYCNHLILELQHVEYNLGSPSRDTVISYLETIGFRLVRGPFANNGPDGDYHFVRINS